MKLLRRILDAYERWREAGNERRRQLDIKLLWPACKAQAPTLADARSAFALHAFRDHAWHSLSADEIERRIEELT